MGTLQIVSPIAIGYGYDINIEGVRHMVMQENNNKKTDKAIQYLVSFLGDFSWTKWRSSGYIAQEKNVFQ